MDRNIPPVLIVGFRRSLNLLSIMQFCLAGGVAKIYVSLDGPRFESDQIDTDACRQVLEKFNCEHPGVLRMKISDSNRGAAHSVLGGLDWVFENEDFAVVIEDDCLPGTDFFNYLLDAKRILDRDENVFLIGGNQFVPSEITHDRWFLSDYPLIWGWATSRKKWLVLRRELRRIEVKSSKPSNSTEFIYWRAGARRALEGFVDAWDTPLVHVLRVNGWHTILPGRNLVKNIGNDLAATHTLKKSKWLEVEALSYTPSETDPEVNPSANDWLKSNLYGISFRHQLTTRITNIRDLLALNKRKRLPLLDRWV